MDCTKLNIFLLPLISQYNSKTDKGYRSMHTSNETFVSRFLRAIILIFLITCFQKSCLQCLGGITSCISRKWLPLLEEICFTPAFLFLHSWASLLCDLLAFAMFCRSCGEVYSFLPVLEWSANIAFLSDSPEQIMNYQCYCKDLLLYKYTLSMFYKIGINKLYKRVHILSLLSF